MLRTIQLLDTSSTNARRRDKVIQLVDRLCVFHDARAELDRLRHDDPAVSRLASSRHIPHRLLFACRSYVPGKPVGDWLAAADAGHGTEEGMGAVAGSGGATGGGEQAGGQLSSEADGQEQAQPLQQAEAHSLGGGGAQPPQGAIDTSFRRQCRVRVVASDDAILSSSLSTVGKLHPYHLLRGGGVTIELLDPPSPPAGPSVVGGGCVGGGGGVTVVEDDWEVMARWFSLIAQALPRAECKMACPDPASAQKRGGTWRGDQGGQLSGTRRPIDGAHFSSGACARFLGRLIAMSLLWDECDGSCLAPSCWDALWVGLHHRARQDAAQNEERLRARRSAGGEAQGLVAPQDGAPLVGNSVTSPGLCAVDGAEAVPQVAALQSDGCIAQVLLIELLATAALASCVGLGVSLRPSSARPMHVCLYVSMSNVLSLCALACFVFTV